MRSRIGNHGMRHVSVLLLLLLGLTCGQVALAEITPGSITVTLRPTESFTESKTVDLPGSIPKADVLFSFDLTGSMGGAINTAKARALEIMNSLDALITDSRFAVASYMDYPDYYSSCGYATTYGDESYGDYAYNLDAPMSADRTAVSSTINSLVLGYGGDGPQNYTRVLYESYADATIGYRAGAKKILVNFADNIPHDCNLNEGIAPLSAPWSTGGDPGRDEVMGTADDLDLQGVLADMATNNVTLLEVHTTSYASAYWAYWTGITGGQHYVITSTTAIPQAIFDLVEAQATHVSSLTLQVTTPGYEAWLTSVSPAAYSDLTLPATAGFDIVVTVPPDALPGTHVFTISAMADGASYGDQLVTVIVPETSVGSIFGQVSLSGGGGLPGVTVKLYEDDVLVGEAMTDGPGHYEFPELTNGDYVVELEVPLGMSTEGESVVPVTVAAKPMEVNFVLKSAASGKVWDIWTWKVQIKAIKDGKLLYNGLTIEQVNQYGLLLFDHFYDRSDAFAIQIPGVTYADGPRALTFDDIYATFFSDDGSYKGKAERALLTNMLNIVAGRQGQLTPVTVDGANASQAITYFAGLYNAGGTSNYYSVYVYLQKMHMKILIPAGIVPLSTPIIMFKPGDVQIPENFSLSQNYPNPFNPTTTINFSLPVASAYTLTIYNMAGQAVSEINGNADAGVTELRWDGSAYSSGVYLYRLTAGTFVDCKKMMLLK